eukprot:TRINITY_DN80969_c0_g1_i1.p1 TRINITY_DN80969_c0_g1~~TRINITY_DN80969_c0_g1_i1.p1  ORF type:complete len:168 (-),score=9.12 TRINITY_DN80969_c0_g1_i1:141-575(-)
MACRQVLVLCGTTYRSRLWCIWELCVVFSFASQGRALERIRFEVLGQDISMAAILQQLQAFEVNNARCYDPNEQARLFNVINTIGSNRFDMQIRQLAAAIDSKMTPTETPRLLRQSSGSNHGPHTAMLGARTLDQELYPMKMSI